MGEFLDDPAVSDTGATDRNAGQDQEDRGSDLLVPCPELTDKDLDSLYPDNSEA